MNFLKKAFFLIFLTGILCQTAMAVDSLKVEARAAILVDVNSGEVLFEQNADSRQYPASLTKIMTALVVSERCNFDELVEAKASAFADLSPDGSSVQIQEGEILSVENLMHCMLISSGNDAANVLAEYAGGTLENFWDLMNQKAAELGCTGTHFANAHGLHDENHYTTARDLYRITRAFAENETLMKIANTVSYVVPATNKTSKQRILNSTNLLISGTSTIQYIYSPARGIKTGTTTPAGYCLISSAEKNNLYLISVVLGAGKDETTGQVMSFVETKRMFEWGFDNYAYQQIVSSGEPVLELSVQMSQEADAVVAVTQTGITALLSSDFDPESVVITPWLYEETLTAPVTKGQVVGEADVSYEGRSYGRIKLVALQSVERSNFMYSWDRFLSYLSKPVIWIGLAAVILIVLAYILIMVFFNRRRRLRRIRKRGRYL